MCRCVQTFDWYYTFKCTAGGTSIIRSGFSAPKATGSCTAFSGYFCTSIFNKMSNFKEQDFAMTCPVFKMYF